MVRSTQTAWRILGVALVVSLSAGVGVACAQVQDGKTIYESKCGGCHSLDANRIGPMHRAIVGRKIATTTGYDYSPAIRKLSGLWTPALLDRWLTNPQAVAPGSAMFFRVIDPPQRQAIIAYLVSVSPAWKPNARGP